MLAHFPLVKRNIRQAISSCQFVCIGDTHILNSNILYRALKRKVLPISTRTLRTMFSLGSVAGGVQICGDGSIFVSRFGPGGPNLGWSKSARTPGRHIESFEVLPAIQQSSEFLEFKTPPVQIRWRIWTPPYPGGVRIRHIHILLNLAVFDYRGNIKLKACAFSLGQKKHPTGHFQLPVRMHWRYECFELKTYSRTHWNVKYCWGVQIRWRIWTWHRYSLPIDSISSCQDSSYFVSKF